MVTMTHYMKLRNEPFEAIKHGFKNIEMRLYDEKRSLINANDIIVFTNTATLENISCKVVNIYRYSTFEELYRHHNKLSIGYKEDENANPDDMLVYYTKEDIKKYGVVGLEILVI